MLRSLPHSVAALALVSCASEAERPADATDDAGQVDSAPEPVALLRAEPPAINFGVLRGDEQEAVTQLRLVNDGKRTL